MRERARGWHASAAVKSVVRDNCPFATPLVVEVKTTGPNWPGSIGVGQVAGGRPITLTGLAPDASGVDFSVGRFAPVR